eukprot:Rhum_TRINITY_DN7930_c1_g1::Rhum_TRINITY_DN7930_c1_g1_i1::g.25256::m.25256
MSSKKYDQLEANVLKECSLNAKLAITSIPVLLALAAFAAVNIQHVNSNLDSIDERPIEYWRFASAVAAALQREKEAATLMVMTPADDPAEVGLAKKELVASLAQLASYHYTHAPKRKHDVMDISSKPLDGPERHLEVFTATLKLDELATLRMQAFAKRHTHDIKAHTAMNKKYDSVVRDLFILSGRQTN